VRVWCVVRDRSEPRSWREWGEGVNVLFGAGDGFCVDGGKDT